MVIRKNMTNEEIYMHATALNAAFEEMSNVVMPVKVHFYFQKNMAHIISMAQDLEKARMDIMQKYGTLDEETHTYKFEEDKVAQANQDIIDLFSVEQEVKINTIPLEWLDNLELTAQQINAFSFMIADEEE